MRDQENWRSPVWMAVLVATAILFSFAFACGMPFAAIGALAALTLGARDAVVLALLGWLCNQAIGFGFQGFPLDAMTLAWGIALGASALVAVCAARIALHLLPSEHLAMRVPVAFCTALVGQQGAVLVSGLVLGASASAFAPGVLLTIFWSNALALALLIAAQEIGARFGVAQRVSRVA